MGAHVCITAKSVIRRTASFVSVVDALGERNGPRGQQWRSIEGRAGLESNGEDDKELTATFQSISGISESECIVEFDAAEPLLYTGPSINQGLHFVSSISRGAKLDYVPRTVFCIIDKPRGKARRSTFFGARSHPGLCVSPHAAGSLH